MRRANRNAFNDLKGKWESKQDGASVPTGFRAGSTKALFKVVAPEPVALPTKSEKGTLFKRASMAPTFTGATVPVPVVEASSEFDGSHVSKRYHFTIPILSY